MLRLSIWHTCTCIKYDQSYGGLFSFCVTDDDGASGRSLGWSKAPLTPRDKDPAKIRSRWHSLAGENAVVPSQASKGPVLFSPGFANPANMCRSRQDRR